MKKQKAIYVRVSSKSQDTRSQEPDLKRWEQMQDVPVVWYRESASGINMDRLQWNRLYGEIQKGAISEVAVWRMDRLGRTASGLTSLFDNFKKFGVNLVSLKDGLDLVTPAGRLMANVLASVAQYDNEVRTERIRAGQSAAKARGRTWGGSKPGIRKKVTEAQIRIVLKMKESGESITDIAKSLSLSRPTVSQIIRVESPIVT